MTPKPEIRKSYHLLLVDDDPLIGASLKLVLPPDWKLIHCPSESEVNYSFPYHAALVDMHLEGEPQNPSGGDDPYQLQAPGLRVISKLKRAQPLLRIMAISGDQSYPLMDAVINAGAECFFGKPLTVGEVLLHLSKIESSVQMRQMAQNYDLEGPRWVGSSPTSEQVRQSIASLCREPGPILIVGESGSGKEVASRLLHYQEHHGPLISVNMAGLTDTLFESELFGHVRGAFTGADSNKVGLIESASGGDLFLDEIEALPLLAQAKLLRFLESGEFKKVGSKESQIASCRVICASNRDLASMVQEGLFREDLYWRLSGKRLYLPPLRERTDDIPDLVSYFLVCDRKRTKKFSEEALEVLKNYSWPGNVRELKRVCEQLILTSPLPIIRGVDAQGLLHYSSSPFQARSETNTQPGRLVRHGLRKPSPKAADPAPATIASRFFPPIDALISEADLSLGLSELTKRFECQVIQAVLTQFKNNIDQTASFLDVSRSSLYKKIRDYQIEIRS